MHGQNQLLHTKEKQSLEDGLFHPNCVHTLGPAVEEELAQKEADQEVSAEGG